MNKIIILMLGVFLITFVSAIYAGECETIMFANQDEVNLTINYNTSSLEGFTWNKIGYEITYCFPTYAELGNYSFSWSNTQDNLPEPITIIKKVKVGGGGTTYIDREVIKEVPTYIYRERIVYTDNPNETEVDEEGIPDKVFIYSILIAFAFVVLGIVVLIRDKIKIRTKSEGGNKYEDKE